MLSTSKEKIHSIFVLDGEIEIENKKNLKGTFLTISKQIVLKLTAKKNQQFLKLYPLFNLLIELTHYDLR